MSAILIKALEGVCTDLERYDANCPSLHFAKGVLAAGVSTVPMAAKRGPQAMELPEDEIIAAYEAGESATSLGLRYSVADETIYRLLRRRGVTIRRRARHQQQFPAIAEMYVGGAGLLECATAFGVSEHAVRRALAANQVQVRPKNACGARKIKWDNQRKARAERIMQLRSEGKTLEQIGVDLGITRERVRQIVRIEGLYDEFLERPFTPEQRAILDEYRSGASLDYVASKLGVSIPTARNWLMRCGIEIRPSTKLQGRKEERQRKARMIAERYLAGEPISQIAPAFGLKVGAQVYRYLAIAGVKPARNVGAGRIAA